ncbi:hypothetical protein M970_100350 [Encephalitozoon cuniculi EcunIII-L]|nr:hypothetical protein M970_100350 [Encephalitozoon cuniculi EcunIII-L]
MEQLQSIQNTLDEELDVKKITDRVHAFLKALLFYEEEVLTFYEEEVLERLGSLEDDALKKAKDALQTAKDASEDLISVTQPFARYSGPFRLENIIEYISSLIEKSKESYRSFIDALGNVVKHIDSNMEISVDVLGTTKQISAKDAISSLLGKEESSIPAIHSIKSFTEDMRKIGTGFLEEHLKPIKNAISENISKVEKIRETIRDKEVSYSQSKAIQEALVALQESRTKIEELDSKWKEILCNTKDYSGGRGKAIPTTIFEKLKEKLKDANSKALGLESVIASLGNASETGDSQRDGSISQEDDSAKLGSPSAGSSVPSPSDTAKLEVGDKAALDLESMDISLGNVSETGDSQRKAAETRDDIETRTERSFSGMQIVSRLGTGSFFGNLCLVFMVVLGIQALLWGLGQLDTAVGVSWNTALYSVAVAGIIGYQLWVLSRSYRTEGVSGMLRQDWSAIGCMVPMMVGLPHAGMIRSGVYSLTMAASGAVVLYVQDAMRSGMSLKQVCAIGGGNLVLAVACLAGSKKLFMPGACGLSQRICVGLVVFVALLVVVSYAEKGRSGGKKYSSTVGSVVFVMTLAAVTLGSWVCGRDCHGVYEGSTEMTGASVL